MDESRADTYARRALEWYAERPFEVVVSLLSVGAIIQAFERLDMVAEQVGSGRLRVSAATAKAPIRLTDEILTLAEKLRRAILRARMSNEVARDLLDATAEEVSCLRRRRFADLDPARVQVMARRL